MKRSQLSRSGFTTTYEEAGNGPPLILLHGFLCDARCWRTQLTGLSDEFRVVAWEAPGAGHSTDPSDPFAMSDWAQVLAEFLDSINVDRAYVLGLSWGGVLAQEFYRSHAKRVMALLLVGTYAGWKGSLSPAVVEQRLARCVRDSELPPDEFASRWVPEMFSAAAPRTLIGEMATIMAGFHPAGFRLMAKSLADSDTTQLLSSINVPTALLWGDDDRRSSLDIAKQLHTLISATQLTVIEHAGHICNMEQPDAFNAHVRAFCSSVAV